MAYQVARFSILRKSTLPLRIIPLKIKDLSHEGWFKRPWAELGDFKRTRIDLIDGRPFATEFSHSRFLVPALMNYEGWALFMDCDMLFTSDIRELYEMRDESYAIQCVQHDHRPKETIKMDNQEQHRYDRKNWSSVVLWNCGHPSNRTLTPHLVNSMSGGWLHYFSWLKDEEIGSLPETWNWLEGHSPLPKNASIFPKNIHYTRGGPWFDEYKDVTYGDLWTEMYERWQRDGNHDEKPCEVPTMKYGG